MEDREEQAQGPGRHLYSGAQLGVLQAKRGRKGIPDLGNSMHRDLRHVFRTLLIV